MAGRLLAELAGSAERGGLGQEPEVISQRSGCDEKAGERSENRFVCQDSLGRRADHFARSSADRGPQLPSSGATYRRAKADGHLEAVKLGIGQGIIAGRGLPKKLLGVPFFKRGIFDGRTSRLQMMEQRVSMVTLGVKELNQSRQFYEHLGWRSSS